ncbi:MAG: hypothetical protein J7K35_03800 [Syntrophobacterales bacterium]|nr:hypothetical protein [Syntrophobacterales bacterium]
MKKQVNIRGVPADVRQNFKIACLQASFETGLPLTMKDVLIQVMRYLGNSDNLIKFMEVKND